LASINAQCAVEPFFADADGGADAQPAEGVLGAFG